MNRSAPKSVARLLNQLRRVLQLAYAEDALRTSPADIEVHVRLASAPEDLRQHFPAAWAVVGGVKDHKRHPSSARLVRDDGAWIHFSVCVEDADGELRVLAYDFEIVFDPRPDSRFVRIDLNQPGHKNDVERARRCHLHPGHDDVQIPWTEADPAEVLSFMLNELRPIKDR